MKQSNINIGVPLGTYDPTEIDPRIIEDETNPDWLFYRDVINALFKADLINDSTRFHMLLAVRKKLGLRVV